MEPLGYPSPSSILKLLMLLVYLDRKHDADMDAHSSDFCAGIL